MNSPYRQPDPFAIYSVDPVRESQARLVNVIADSISELTAQLANEDNSMFDVADYEKALAALRETYTTVCGSPDGGKE